MSARVSGWVVGSILSLACLMSASAARADGSGEWKSGKETYDKVCAYCHDKGVGPDIKGRGAPPAYRTVVRYGRGAMPPFRVTEISDEALAKLMDHIK